MKITIEESNQTEIPFPKFMVADINLLVFFTAPEVGVVIQKGLSKYTTGDSYTSWDMRDFKDIRGKIIIEQ